MISQEVPRFHGVESRWRRATSQTHGVRLSRLWRLAHNAAVVAGRVVRVVAATMHRMYLDALDFLDEEREAFRPFEALADLSDEQLGVPVAGAHGWSGRQLMGHLLSGQEVALAVATELAVNETSPAKERADADWDTRGGEVVNAEIDARWAALSMADLRARFGTLPGQLRGYLTVVPESRWLKHADHQRFFLNETTAHYEDHVDDLAAILAAAGR
jgi:hypothetical protein